MPKPDSPRKPRKVRKRPTQTIPAPCTSPECQDFAMLLTEYWESSEDLVLREEIEHHIRLCPGCAEILSDYTRTVRICQSVSRVSEPLTVHRELWERLAAQLPILRELR